MSCHQFANACGKVPRRGRPNLQPKAAQHAAEAHRYVEIFRLQQLTCSQQSPRMIHHRVIEGMDGVTLIREAQQRRDGLAG